MKKIFAYAFMLVCLLSCAHTKTAVENTNKREFRGAWIQSVNGQFQGMSTATMQQTLTYQLDELKKDGVNTIIFQVRPECDALYESKLEPWSRFLTGQQGRAPQPYWDPLQWMVEQCHQRGMELHAWINPYRARTKTTTALATNHVASMYPDRVFAYDGLLILNPGNPINRDYICKVVQDIVRRYDIDGLHIDDYFYPYPAAGQQIPDNREFELYNPYKIQNRNDWRRENVNIFIKELHKAIHDVKPWVKFGVSPFGIYHNHKTSNDPIPGSATKGLQNYDDLYADVLLWVNKGWVDYCVPQLYWEIGHSSADYEPLISFWNDYASNRPLFIGEDIERTVKNVDPKNPGQNQMPAKMRLHKQMKNVGGTVLWYAKAAVDNVGNYGNMLRKVYWKNPVLQPSMPFIDKTSPKKVKKMKILQMNGEPVLFWTQPNGSGWKHEAVKYVVYHFAQGEKIDISDGSHIQEITSNNFHKIRKSGGTYVVTALDRLSNESKPVKIKR